MTTKNTKLHNIQIASAILFLIAVALAIVILVNLVMYAADTAAYADSADPNQDPNQPAMQKEQAPPVSKSKELADALKQKNLFLPPPPKPQPPGEVKGILGNQALINGQWYKVGDTIPPGAKVIKIEATLVKLEWEGKEIILAPIKASSAPGAPQGPKNIHRPSPKAMIKPNAPVQQAPVEQVQTAEEDDLAWLDIPAHLKDKFRPMWNKMSDADKQQAKDRWNSLSDEQKQQAISAMENMPG